MGTRLLNNGKRQRAFLLYWTSVGILCLSIFAAARLYPETYDWQYTVISALASPKHNPEGYRYLAAGLALAMAILLPFVKLLPKDGKTQNRSTKALTMGLFCGTAMGIESFSTPPWPEQMDKVHELLALLCFLFIYGGILGYSIANARKSPERLIAAGVISLPLIAIGICQLSLYLGQRDLGWVDQSWREMGIPLWQSFAFWQWIALVCLWAAMGLLRLLSPSARISKNAVD